MTEPNGPSIRVVRHYVARLFPSPGTLAGEVLLWDDAVTGPPLAILSFWPDGADVPASGPLDDGRWHLEFGVEAWERVVGLLQGDEVMLVAGPDGPHLSTGLNRAGPASSRLPL
jgi:hypothetical protein